MSSLFHSLHLYNLEQPFFICIFSFIHLNPFQVESSKTPPHDSTQFLNIHLELLVFLEAGLLRAFLFGFFPSSKMREKECVLEGKFWTCVPSFFFIEYYLISLLNQYNTGMPLVTWKYYLLNNWFYKFSDSSITLAYPKNSTPVNVYFSFRNLLFFF